MLNMQRAELICINVLSLLYISLHDIETVHVRDREGRLEVVGGIYVSCLFFIWGHFTSIGDLFMDK